MCVIIHKPKGIALDDSYIKEAWRYNSHGFGVMWHDPERDKICHWKRKEIDVDKVCEFVKGHKDTEMALHFRIKTHGLISDENCHPFRILSKKKHNVDMFFMHNGTITGFDQKDEESDTRAFNRIYLQQVLKYKPGLIKSSAFRLGLEKMIGGSKLLFMFGNGTVLKVNEKAGVERDGCWFSNTSAFPVEKTTHTTRWPVVSNKKKEHVLLGVPVEVGDKVYLWAQNATEWLGEGRITDFLYGTQIMIAFKDEKGKDRSLVFYCYDGESSFSDGYYFCIPEKYHTSSYEGQTISQILRDDNHKDISETLEKQAEEQKKTADDDSVEEKIDEELVDESLPPNIVEHKGIKVNTSLQYGAENLESVYDLYGLTDLDGVTFFDVFNFDPQARFEFFLDKPEEAFNMFQDLLEYFCIFGVDDLEEKEEEQKEQKI